MTKAAALLAPTAVALSAVGVSAFVWLADPTAPGGLTPLCPSKSLFGVVCPGCGSSRMLYCLLHGNWSGALHYNAVGTVAIGLLVWSYLAWALARVRNIHLPRWDRWRWAPIAVLVVVSAWFMVRNLPWAPFSSLRV